MDNQLLNLVSTRTKWLTQRHGVLAQNVANADTPDFEAMDLRQIDLDDLHRLAGNKANRLSLARTHHAHVSGVPLAPLGALRPQDIEGFELSPDGNGVVVEEQVSKMAKTQLDYQLMTNIYRKNVEMYRTALGKGN
jgi:flagellar basal-body rod protein FlgB